MNRKCPFCGSDKLKVESKNSTRSLRTADRSAGYKSKFTGSVRCNRCFSRGPTVYILCAGDSISLTEKSVGDKQGYPAWNNIIF